MYVMFLNFTLKTVLFNQTNIKECIYINTKYCNLTLGSQTENPKFTFDGCLRRTGCGHFH